MLRTELIAATLLEMFEKINAECWGACARRTEALYDKGQAWAEKKQSKLDLVAKKVLEEEQVRAHAPRPRSTIALTAALLISQHDLPRGERAG
jgi:hypothetical protein